MTRPQTTFGYVVPPSEGDSVPSSETLFAIAEAADSSVLSHLWVSDHIVWWFPMHDSLTLLAALAARTSRVKIGPAVLLLAMRNPVLVAKAVASMQVLSGGRITLGVGVGGEFPPEWEAVGTDRRTRARRTDEMIDALRALWSPGAASFSGKHVTLDGVDLHPKPDPPPPVWVGGRSDAALRRAAERGDGWMGIFTTPERYASQLDTVRRFAGDAGRDPMAIAPSLYIWTCIADTDAEARAIAEPLLGAFYNVPFEKLERYAVIGSAKTCARRFREFADAGARHFAVAPVATHATVEPLRRLVDEVMPKFDAL